MDLGLEIQSVNVVNVIRRTGMKLGRVVENEDVYWVFSVQFTISYKLFVTFSRNGSAL